MGQAKDINLFFIFLICVEISLISLVTGQENVVSQRLISELKANHQRLISNEICSNDKNNEVFNGTVCSLSADNIIDIETRKRTQATEIARINSAEEMEDHTKCQQNCFGDQLCRNFTYFHHTDEANGIHTYKCILFRRCGNQLKCATCITGPPAPARPKNCEKTLMKELLAEVIDVKNEGDLTGEELGRLIQRELGLYLLLLIACQ